MKCLQSRKYYLLKNHACHPEELQIRLWLTQSVWCNKTKVVGLIPVLDIHSRSELGDHCAFLPVQNILWSVKCYLSSAFLGSEKNCYIVLWYNFQIIHKDCENNWRMYFLDLILTVLQTEFFPEIHELWILSICLYGTYEHFGVEDTCWTTKILKLHINNSSSISKQFGNLPDSSWLST